MPVLDSYVMPDWVRGDTYDGATLTFKKANGDPIDLTGATVYIAFRFGSKDGDLGIVLCTPGATPIVGAKRMVSVLTINAHKITIGEFITDMDAGQWVFDVQVIFSGGRVKTYYEGTWLLEQDVTPNTAPE